jgi:hypothetical protein
MKRTPAPSNYDGDRANGLTEALHRYSQSLTATRSSLDPNIKFPANREFNREFLFFEAVSHDHRTRIKSRGRDDCCVHLSYCDYLITNAMTLTYKTTNCQPTAEFQAVDRRNSKPVLLAAGRERNAPALAR